MRWIYISLAAGYAFSLLVGGYFTNLNVNAAHIRVGSAKPEVRGDTWLVQAVGYLERTLYTACWHFGKEAFVAVWLALKVAGQWEAWAKGTKSDEGKSIKPRELYSVFLIGNALSLLYGVTGGMLIEWLKHCQWASAVLVPVLLMLGSGTLWYFTQRAKERKQQERLEE